MAHANSSVQARLAVSAVLVAIYHHVKDGNSLQLTRFKSLLANKRYDVKSFIGMEKPETVLVIHGILTQYTRKRLVELLKEHHELFPQL